MSTGTTYFLILVMVYIIVVWGALIPFRAGLLYNGTVYCMAVGGYLAAYASKNLGWGFWLCIVVAALLGLLFGFLPALGFARTNGIVTAVSSMALIFIIQSVIRNIKVLGGSSGIYNIPKVPNLLLFTIIVTVIMGAILFRLDHSRLGRALEAIGTDSEMAATLGINNQKLTVLALTLSSVFASVAGVIYAFNLRLVYPDAFSFTFLLNMMTMLFVGGRYTQWGVIISAPVLWTISTFMPKSVQKLSNYIYAVILIVILMARPEGLVTRGMVQKIKLFFTGLWNKIFHRQKVAA